jgi:hypothetical protein
MSLDEAAKSEFADLNLVVLKTNKTVFAALPGYAG